MRYEELTCQEVERILPGFRASTTHLESVTPTRFERWTRNRSGAIHGWESVPNQSTPKRLPRVCPIKGLLLAGHWTEPGSGAVRTIYSGFQTVQQLTGHETGPDLLAALEAADPR
jgi:prolycopene isomerase